MKKLVCTSCGAPINAQTLVCDYCGSVFLSSKVEAEKSDKNEQKAKENKIEVPAIYDSELNNLIKTFLNRNTKSHKQVSANLAIWVIVLIFITTVLLNSPVGELGLIPVVFIVIGISTIFNNIKTLPGIKYFNAIRALNKCDYEEAYEEFGEIKSRKNRYEAKYCQILIGYYRLNKFDEVRDLIINMDANDLSKIMHCDFSIMEIANQLLIKVPDCKDPDCDHHH